VLGGIHLTVLIGRATPTPASAGIMESIRSIEVTHNDEGPSGFQIALDLGRSGPLDLADYPLVRNPVLQPFSRVVFIVTMNVVPRVLMDGIITQQQVVPGTEPGTGTLTLTGEDVSVMMDLEKRREEHRAQDDLMIAVNIINRYRRYGLVAMAALPPVSERPLPVERVPTQQDTDRGYLKTLGERYGFTFFVIPGPAPLSNIGYWGPPRRGDTQQRALSVNMGPDTNVDAIEFQYNALAPTAVSDTIQDSRTNRQVPIRAFVSSRPPLASLPALPFNLPDVRTSLLEENFTGTEAQARAQAQAVTDRSMDAVVTATGELDAMRYGDLLMPRGVVGVRGVGFSYGGLYYVKSVTHQLGRGQYRQKFALTREGLGALGPVVRP
jgi:hypothetical protein